MLYLEKLVDAIIAEEGQTLMGLDFLMETLELPMKKIELIFKKALSEYSERRPLKKTDVIYTFNYVSTDGNSGYIQMPEGTTSCRVARYGVLPDQMPRYYMPKIGTEQNVEFDPVTLTCRVWPPVLPLRMTYTQKLVPTTSVLIEQKITLPYTTDEVDFDLETSYAASTLYIQKAVTTGSGESATTTTLTMSPTGYTEEEEGIDGEVIKKAELSGTLGSGYVNLKTREVSLSLTNSSISPLLITYYPKYSVVKDLDDGNFVFTKLFASKLLGALASLRSQAEQEKLHNITLSQDELYTRVQELKKEVHEELKSTLSFGDIAPF